MVLLCCLNVAVDAHRVPAIKVRYPDVVALIGLPVGAAGNGRSGYLVTEPDHPAADEIVCPREE